MILDGDDPQFTRRYKVFYYKDQPQAPFLISLIPLPFERQFQILSLTMFLQAIIRVSEQISKQE